MKKLDLSKLNVNTLRAITKSETLEDFLQYIKKHNVDLSQEEAAGIFNILKNDFTQLEDEQLELISGGAGSALVPCSNKEVIIQS